MDIQGKFFSFFGLSPKNISSDLFKRARSSFLLNILNIVLSLAATVVLARILGAEGYGVYTYALTLAGIMGLLANLGMPNLIVREISTYFARGNWAQIRGLLKSSHRIVLTISLVIVTVAGGASLLASEHLERHMLATFLISLILVPLRALYTLREATLRALHHVVLGQVPEMLVRPCFFIVTVVLLYRLLDRSQLIAEVAMTVQVTATALAFIIGTILLSRYLPDSVKQAEAEVEAASVWIRRSIPFVFIGGSQLVNSQIDIVMLGWLRNTYDVGVYRVAVLGANLVVFGLMAANIVLGPVIAATYSTGDIIRLQRIITLSSRAILLYSLPTASILIVFGEPLLSLIFGSEFRSGSTALSILSVGQLLNAAIGSVGLILLMTGNEADALKGIAIAAVVNVSLNLILIPHWGMTGAAVATTISLVVWNVILAFRVFRKTGLHTTALSPLSKKPV